MANAKRHPLEAYAYVNDLLMQMTWLLVNHDVEVLVSTKRVALPIANGTTARVVARLIPRNWPPRHENAIQPPQQALTTNAAAPRGRRD
jgi:hypothetical protein